MVTKQMNLVTRFYLYLTWGIINYHYPCTLDELPIYLDNLDRLHRSHSILASWAYLKYSRVHSYVYVSCADVDETITHAMLIEKGRKMI